MVEFAPAVESWVTDILVWIGYGTVVGLLAKAVMPGRDPGGALATLAMGITGVIIGCGVWSLLGDVERVTPISPSGLVAGTLGAFVILLFYRMLGGYWYEEPAQSRRRPTRRLPPGAPRSSTRRPRRTRSRRLCREVSPLLELPRGRRQRRGFRRALWPLCPGRAARRRQAAPIV